MSANIAGVENDLIAADCMTYLDKIGLADRLPAWRELCTAAEEDTA